MKSSDKLAQEIASKGIEGDIEIDTLEFYTKVADFLSEFDVYWHDEKGLNTYACFPIHTEIDEEDSFLGKIARTMNCLACSIKTELIGIVILFSLDNFLKELRAQGITKVSEVFLKRSIFGVLFHEYYHLRDNGKHLDDIIQKQKNCSLEHDNDPEEIQADEYAINLLRSL